MSQAAIEFSSVVKKYKNTVVINGIDLLVDRGEYVGLVGVNGAGKTTLIKSLLDFCHIDSGSITIFGVDNRKPESREKLVFLPERFLPPYYLTGRDFMSYMSRLHGIVLSDNQVSEMFEVLDLDADALSKPVREYSKGMAQKLGLAACFLSGKELFILDEPMSGLDPKARAQLKQYLIQMKGEGKTLFFSTHMLNDVEALCDRIAVLHQGQLRFIGTPQQCCEKFGASDLEAAYLSCIKEE